MRGTTVTGASVTGASVAGASVAGASVAGASVAGASVAKILRNACVLDESVIRSKGPYAKEGGTGQPQGCLYPTGENSFIALFTPLRPAGHVRCHRWSV